MLTKEISMHFNGRVFRLRMPSLRQIQQWWTQRSFRASLYTLIVGIFFLVVLHYLIQLETQTDEYFYFRFLPIPQDPDFKPFGISSLDELSATGTGKIPKRIHQTWKSEEIPHSFHTWIRSWTAQHPDWEYWLWTDSSARLLVAERFPALLPVYDSYQEPIRRADALRYVVLHEFGGVYADMDMESLKPIDPLAFRYSCFIGQEPYVHPIMDTNTQALAINALMACRPGHPFLAEVVARLPDFAHMWSALDSTGPHFLTAVLRQYQRAQHKRSPDQESGVFLAPAEYFYPNMDPEKFGYMYRMCASSYRELGSLQQKACQSLKRTLPPEKRSALAFTNHHWVHTYLTVRVSLAGSSPIKDVVPHVKIYSPAGRR